MRKIDLPLVLDALFYSLSAFVLSIGIMRYYRLPYAASIPLSAVVFFAVGTIFLLTVGRIHRKRALTRKEGEERDALMLHLALEKEEKVRALFYEAYEKSGRETENGDELLLEGKRAVPLFSMQPVSADEIANLIRRYEREFTVLANALSPEAKKLLDSFGIKSVQANEVYAFLKETECFPERLILGGVPRKKARDKLRSAFKKQNARPFFVSGVLLLIMSLFTFFPLYYLISGSVLLISAVLVRLVGVRE